MEIHTVNISCPFKNDWLSADYTTILLSFHSAKCCIQCQKIVSMVHILQQHNLHARAYLEIVQRRGGGGQTFFLGKSIIVCGLFSGLVLYLK